MNTFSAKISLALLLWFFGQLAHDAAQPSFAELAAMPTVAPQDGNSQQTGQDSEIDDGSAQMIIVRPAKTSAPQFLYATSASSDVEIRSNEVQQSINVQFRTIQGTPKSVRLAWNGPAEIREVTGDAVVAWAIRTRDGQRFLDLELKPDATELTANVRSLQPLTDTMPQIEISHLAPGESVGFDSRIAIQYAAGLSGKIVEASGFLRQADPLADQTAPSGTVVDNRFQTSSGGKLVVLRSQLGAIPGPVELEDMTLEGDLQQASRSVAFQLKGKAIVRRPGARLRLLSGNVALAELPQDQDYQVHLAIENGEPHYELEFPESGEFDIQLSLEATLLHPDTNWNAVQFSVAANAVVPITLKGFEQQLEFQRNDQAIVPIWSQDQWQAFLPANGDVKLQWKSVRSVAEGKLFFTTSARIEARVGPGLLRQNHSLKYQVLQGQLKSLTVDLVGPGEILDVQGQNVVGWKVVDEESARRLEITLSKPILAESQFEIRSQTPLDAFPVRVDGLSLQPRDAIRHSGHLRIANTGSVRLTPTNLVGLTQLGPEHFPGEAIEARQLFVYRFPSSQHQFTIVADRIQPEVQVNELSVYSVSQSERIISSDMELDIREAGIREWRFSVPEDYSVVSVTGAGVSDYIVATESADGYRDLKVIFGQDLMGRQLIRLRLERNQVTDTDNWILPRILHPEAKALRGDIGVVGAPGFRIGVANTELLVEKPLSTFPQNVPNLQQAFRIRQPQWTATIQIERLEQSIQSDLFHLYSLSQGTVYGSVLVNYFITGAPASELTLTVPAALGNATVDGRDIRSWRRDGDNLIVTLHQPVMGPYTLLLTFEQKPEESDDSFIAGSVIPQNVQGDRGFIQVVSPMQVEIEPLLTSDSLLELDPLELPAEFRLLSTAPALGTWQYTQRPFDLKLQVNWFEPGSTATQVVEFSEANSHVSPDGELVTDVVYFVKTRGQRSLRVQLPGDPVRLWAVSVNGSPVTARQSQDITLIPLPGGADPNIPVEVSLRLGKPAVDQETTLLTLPTVEAPVLKTQWNVQADENHVLVPTGGNVDAVHPVIWPNGFHWLAGKGLIPLLGITVLTILACWMGRIRKPTATPLPTEDLPSSQDDTETTEATISAVPGAEATSTSWIGGGFHSGLVVLLSGLAVVVALATGVAALEQAEPPSPLQVNLPVLAAGENIAIEVQNIPAWQVHFSWLGLGLLGGGLLLSWVSRWGRWRPIKRLLFLIAIGLMTVGVLLQFHGAIWFFVLIALLLLVVQLGPALGRLGSILRHNWQQRSERKSAAERASETPEPSDGSGVVTTTLLLTFAWLASYAGSSAMAADDDGFPTASSLNQQWDVNSSAQRLTASATVTVSGRPGDQFLLLRSPAVLTDFEGEGLRLSKRFLLDVGMTYLLTIPLEETIERDRSVSDQPSTDPPPQPDDPSSLDPQNVPPIQRLTATFKYRMEAIAPVAGIPVPTGDAAVRNIDLTFDQAGWEVVCPSAAKIEVLDSAEVDGEPATRAQLLLRAGQSTVILRPKARDLASEETQFFVEGAQLYVPGPGVVDGKHRLSIRTSQGKIQNLNAIIPEGLTVSSVNGPVTSWQFDADNRRLNLEIDSAADTSFDILVETQRALEPLPAELNLSPIRVEEAGGEVGLIALAFGNDAQPESIESSSFSQVNIGDFDASLVGESQVVIQRVFRYGVQPGELSARVIPVAAEIRVASRQVLSLGDERIVLAVNLVAEISRTGVFQLSFPLPDGLEVESLSGDALHHWSELTEDDQRSIVMHLNGKTIGPQNFSLSLAGPAPPDAGDWQVPHFELHEATRQSGELLIRPIPGIRLRTVTRQNVSELDPRSMGGGGNDTQGTLAFRLLQRDWNLVLGIEKLDPWVTAQVLHEVALREGQTRSTLTAEIEIENASLRSLPITLPISDPEVLRTVRATGSAVSDFVRSAPDSDTWNLQFKRRVIGKVQFQIEFERRGERTTNQEILAPAGIPQARQLAYYYAVRTGGRLETDPVNLTEGWQRMDWNMVPPSLRESGNRNAPALTLRAVSPSTPLSLNVIRHSLADALKLRVAEGTLTTILSPNGDQLTAVDVTIEVIQRSSLAVQLPAGGQLFNIFVNGESVHSIRQDDTPNGWQFYILPGMDDRTAQVRFVYSVTGEDLRLLNLVSPELNVPLENVKWDVVAPPGFQLTNSDGNLELVGQDQADLYDRSSYLSIVSGKREEQAKQATELLQRASELLQAGEQTKARWALNNVANRYALDAASNEDARVQLENLQTQQAIVGLNTRRQRILLDNGQNDVLIDANEQLRQAAAANPILQQDRMKFRPQELSQLLAGNTSEDNAILQQIADRLVHHQRTTEPAPQAIVISLPEEGTYYRFSRGVQVAENAPLQLQLEFHSQYQLQLWQWGAVAGILTVMAVGLAWSCCRNRKS